jgi:hypothetical protein
MQETQFVTHVIWADLHYRFVLAFKAVVGSPVHSLGFYTVTMENAKVPHQSCSQLIGLCRYSVTYAFFLSSVT